MKLAPIWDPAARRPSPKPMQVDLRKAFIFGICMWTLALIVSLVGWLGFHMEWFHTSTYICGFGIIIGCCLLVWEWFDRSDYRRLGR